MTTPTRTVLAPELVEILADLKRIEPDLTYWSSLSQLLKTGTAKAAYAIPIAAYLILYSDYLSKWLLLDPNSTGAGFLTSVQRAHLLYLGGCCLFVSFVLFYFLSPWVIRKYADRSALVAAATSTRDYIVISAALTALAPAYEALKLTEYAAGKMKPEDEKQFNLMWSLGSGYQSIVDAQTLNDPASHTQTPTHLTLYYNRRDRERPVIRYVIFVIAAVGYLGIAIPAFDMFVRVMRKIMSI